MMRTGVRMRTKIVMRMVLSKVGVSRVVGYVVNVNNTRYICNHQDEVLCVLLFKCRFVAFADPR
jgi:hypothetical protein